MGVALSIPHNHFAVICCKNRSDRKTGRRPSGGLDLHKSDTANFNYQFQKTAPAASPDGNHFKTNHLHKKGARRALLLWTSQALTKKQKQKNKQGHIIPCFAYYLCFKAFVPFTAHPFPQASADECFWIIWFSERRWTMTSVFYKCFLNGKRQNRT